MLVYVYMGGDVYAEELNCFHILQARVSFRTLSENGAWFESQR
jgi:hypothetical protein